MRYRTQHPPKIKIRSYDTNLDSYERQIDLQCTKEISRILNSDETIVRSGFEIELDLISDDIDEIRKKLHLLTYMRKEGENK